MNRSSCSLLLLISLFTLLFLVFIHPVNCLSCDTVSSIADLQTSAANPSITAICITAGTYSLPSELVFVRSTNLMLIGLGSLASDTIFIASGSFRVMSLNSTAAITFSIQKITFQNGSPNIGPGGCLRVAGSTGTTLSIDSSNFQNCIAPSLGGGIAMLSITAVANITNTAFWNNRAAGYDKYKNNK